MRILGLPFLSSLQPLGPLMARIGVGVVMILHGWSKYQSGADGWVSGKMLGQMAGLPAEPALAWLVMLVELVGGALILLGLLTRISSVLVAIVMIVALVTVKGFAFLTPEGQVWAGNIDWVILFTALTLAFIGPGAISVDKVLGIDR